METNNTEHGIPELQMISEIARRCLPPGHRLQNVDLSFGSLEENQDPRFLVLVELAQERPGPEPFGWADKLGKIIRETWPNDAFYVKVKILLA